MTGNAELWRGLPEQALVEYIQRLEQRIRNLENRTYRIPVLEVDPEDGDPCNLWAYEDGTLNFRDSDSNEYQYLPYGITGIPTLNNDPAASTNIDIWLIASNGQIRIRAANGDVYRYNAETPASTPAATKPRTPPKPKPPNPTKKRYAKVWSATWSESYEGDGGRRTDNNHLYFGNYPSSGRGRQRSLIGFDYAGIQAALSGATINKVELYLHNLHSYSNSGVYIDIGGHQNSSRPGSYSGAVKYKVSSVRWGKPESAFKTVSTWIGKALRDNVIKGILLDPRSDSISKYGYAAGVSDSGFSPPRLRITYTK